MLGFRLESNENSEKIQESRIRKNGAGRADGRFEQQIPPIDERDEFLTLLPPAKKLKLIIVFMHVRAGVLHFIWGDLFKAKSKLNEIRTTLNCGNSI